MVRFSYYLLIFMLIHIEADFSQLFRAVSFYSRQPSVSRQSCSKSMKEGAKENKRWRMGRIVLKCSLLYTKWLLHSWTVQLWLLSQNLHKTQTIELTKWMGESSGDLFLDEKLMTGNDCLRESHFSLGVCFIGWPHAHKHLDSTNWTH